MKLPKMGISILGKASTSGYSLEIVSPKDNLVQRDNLLWEDFPEVPKSAIIEAFILAYVKELSKRGEHFVLEYHCGEDNCYGSHVMTDANFKKVKK